MTLLISYFIVFGIITITNGKPAYKDDSYFIKNEHELRKLLQALADQGKYDMVLSHHEDGPETHHEDKARILHHDDAPRKYYRNEKSRSGHHGASHEHLGHDDHPSLTNIQTLNLFYKKKPNNLQRLSNNDHSILDNLIGLESGNSRGQADEDPEYDNAEDILAFLSDLQQNLGNVGNYGSPLRCSGKNCARSRIDINNEDPNNDKADDDRNDNDIRCSGNRCGRNRVESTDDKNDRGDSLRCRGNNCARNRVDRNEDRNNRDNLRCIGDRCYADDRDDDNDREDRNGLRCRGKQCARSRYDDSDSHTKYDSNLLNKKIKLSDDAEAVIIDMSDVERVLSKSDVPKQKHTNKARGAKLLENVDLENLLDNKNDNSNGKKSNVEAVVFDLTQMEDGNNVAKQIERLLSQSNLEVSEEDYDGYGIQGKLKRGSSSLNKKQYHSRSDSKILPHYEDNNNVYVPKWLLNEVISKTNLRDSQVDLLKSVFPLTKKQREKLIKSLEQRKDAAKPRKIFRRTIEHDVGVPFHLEVQGLGQVSP